jgi:DNA-binding NarL/FixJ family response regulator
MAGGASTRLMAEKLHVSTATIPNHVQNVLEKLDVHSRLEAAAYASRHGWL